MTQPTTTEAEMAEVLERSNVILKAIYAEVDRQCGIGAGMAQTCGETGLFQVSADIDIITLSRAIAKALASTAPAPAPVGVEGLGLELSEDGYSLRTPYDGDVDGDGRHIVVGGEVVCTFADSDEGERVRDAILTALSPAHGRGITLDAASGRARPRSARP